VVRTLLHYYCSERYHVRLKEDGIRLVGDEISEEEWIDPVAARTDLPQPRRNEQMSDALNLIASAGLEADHRHTVTGVVDYMRRRESLIEQTEEITRQGVAP